ncbi:dTMP kinase [Desulfuribacillus alkaliarsenatis]|uniref:Thymidylate kinase n=1 Tax=Desulfuribacillus alkaliarsenatis TaxID=766136 RepID=A0A1E5FZ68_9FIRM|nr:dTMP kinase [Desulfuribacillus alkaliarsenatis]OEF95737.1 dTMP kinase [Desulfuribacillus alkaliarsenatis]
MSKGLFITFEGTEGGGKSTQVKLFVEKLTAEGYNVVQTREPGGTLISEKIRAILLDPENNLMDGMTEMLLYAASRAQHAVEVIKPALEQGKIVVCDRFIDASIAYQGYGMGLSIEKILLVNSLATGELVPNRTYMLDLPVEIGMQRIAEKRGHNEDLRAIGLDRIESKAIEYHRKVRSGFLQIANTQPERVTLIDATQDIGAIEQDIWKDFLQMENSL